MHVPHMGCFHTVDLSVCLKTELPGTVLDKADNLSLQKDLKFDLTAGENCIVLNRTKECRSLSVPPTPG